MFANKFCIGIKMQYRALRRMATKLHTTKITENIDVLTIDKCDNFDNPRPLVILLSWLMAQPKHIHKFAELYTHKGFDVMSVNLKPLHLLIPTTGSQVVASEILNFLDSNAKSKILLIHGFSIGGYLWGETLLQMKSQKYKHISEKIVGQVWDSVADVDAIPYGFPRALFPNNLFLQGSLRYYTRFHMKMFYKLATRHYEKSSHAFHNNFVKAPALMFLSKSDPIGTEESIMVVRRKWEANGISIRWKCWEDSPHVNHYHRHSEEYANELYQFIDHLTLKMPSKL